MTKNEAIKWQRAFKKTYNGFPRESEEACDEAIKALEEVQEYRKIGTVEDLREAAEKQKPKKVIDDIFDVWYRCQNCKRDLTKIRSIYCPYCGQKLDWSEEK